MFKLQFPFPLSILSFKCSAQSMEREKERKESICVLTKLMAKGGDK